MEQTYITLNDGNKIPQFGLGVYMVPEGAETENAVANSLALGVRHIDTAHAYQNEKSVGRAIKSSRIDREEIWITSKLWPSEYGEEKTMKAIDKMLQRLDVNTIDLLLLHQQIGDYIGAWKDMEKAVALGKVHSIGISNFNPKRLEKLCNIAQIKPSVLQVECHPYFQQNELKKIAKKYGIAIEAWYPIGHGDPKLINESIFTELGKKYGKSNVQIILRWHIQEGNIIFPKTTNPEHMKDNFNIFDFELSKDEMNQIRKLENGKKYFNLPLVMQEVTFRLWNPKD